MAGVVSGCGETRWGAAELPTGARGLVKGDRVRLCQPFHGGLWQSFSCPGGGCDVGTMVSVRSGAGLRSARVGVASEGCRTMAHVDVLEDRVLSRNVKI